MDIFVNIKASADKASGALKEAARSTSKLGRETKSTNSKMAAFFSQLKKGNSHFTNIVKDVNRASTGFASLGRTMKGVLAGVGIAQLANWTKTAVSSSLDMIETQNLFTVALGESAETATEFLGTMSKATGMDITNLKSATATYALLARSMGMTTTQAETLSINSTQLALDLASLTNVPVAQALGDIKSGLIGQTETMYKYGVDLTEAALKEEALAEGISKSVRQMSQGEKMALRYNLMLKQTSLSQGDFAKTLESPANQLKILSERVVTAGRSIGSIFIPALTYILPIANAVMVVITQLADAIAGMLGYKAPESNATGIKTITEYSTDATDAVDDTTEALEKMNNTALGFDELNTIQPDTSASASGGVGSNTSALAEIDLSEYESGMQKLSSKADEYAQDIMDAFYKRDWTALGQLIADGINSFVGKINLGNGLDKIASFGEGFISSVSTLINSVVAGVNWLDVGILLGNGINTVVDFLLNLISAIDFVTMGAALGNVLNGAILTVDWFKVGALMNSMFAIQLDLLTGFVNTFDFTSLGTAIADYINGGISVVDAEQFGTTMNTLATGIFDTLVTAISEIDWESIGSKIQTFFEALDLGGIVETVTSGVDWETAGTSFASGFNTVTDTLLTTIEGIDFSSITASLAGFLNGAIGEINWGDVGATLTSGFSIALDLLAGFTNEFDFSGLGTAVSDLINGAFESIDWVKLGQTVSDTAIGLLESLTTAIEGVDWLQIGLDIATFLGEIDWTQIVKDLATAFGTALGGLITLLAGFLHDVAVDIGEYFGEKFEEQGGDIIAGLLSGISDALNAIGVWLEENVVTPIVDGVKKMLGINSPSTVFAEIGEFLIEGLKKGIEETWEKITKFFTDAWDGIKQIFNDAWDSIKLVAGAISTWFSENVTAPLENLFKGVVNSIIGFFENMINGIILGLNWLIDKANWLLSGINDFASVLGFDVDLQFSTIPPIAIPRLARGGMLKAGSLFEAGENGKAEMLGGYKGQTTVMPLENTDFVKSIYDAVVTAMTDSQSGGGQVIENILTLDGDVVYRNQQQVSQRRGRNFGLGAFAR